MNIFFDKSLKRDFIASQKLGIDEAGYIIDLNNDKRVMDSNKNYIKASAFGGFRKGSRIFLTEDINTIIVEANLSKV